MNNISAIKDLISKVKAPFDVGSFTLNRVQVCRGSNKTNGNAVHEKCFVRTAATAIHCVWIITKNNTATGVRCMFSVLYNN